MAFFKFRKGGDDHAAAPSSPAPESLEAMRKRARHRLIGAAVLVLLGVIGFPLIFDSQPRPIAVDMTIEIPDKTKVKPLRNTAPVVAATGSASGKTAAGSASTASTAVAGGSAVPMASASRVVAGSVSPSAMITEVDSKPAAKAEAKPVPKPVEKAPEKAAGKAAEKPVSPDADKKLASAEGRFVVQVGAFSDAIKAREARVKLEKAGLKTYTQVIESKDGKRIRVRVGPFANKQEAEKAADKIKKLDLPAGILEL